MSRKKFCLHHSLVPSPLSFLFYARLRIAISIIIGDVLHNLRSALDLLACQLARRPEAGKVRKIRCDGTEFPIKMSPKKFLSALKTGKVRILGEDALEIIKGLKPYQGGDDRFWLLHKLNIIDKHRLLIVASLATYEEMLESTNDGVTIRIDMVQLGLGGPKIVEDGDILLSQHGELDMKFDMFFYIVFNEAGVVVMEKIESQLLRLRDAVKDTLDALAPLIDTEKPI